MTKKNRGLLDDVARTVLEATPESEPEIRVPIDPRPEVEEAREEAPVPRDRQREIGWDEGKMYFRVGLSKELVERYSTQGDVLEATLEKRLQSCVSHTAEKPIYIGDDLRRRIEKVLGVRVDDGETLLTILQRGLQFELLGHPDGPISIATTFTAMERLGFRKYGNETYREGAQRVVKRLLETELGVF